MFLIKPGITQTCICYADDTSYGPGCTQQIAEISGNLTADQCNIVCGRNSGISAGLQMTGCSANAYKISNDPLNQCHTTILPPNPTPYDIQYPGYIETNPPGSCGNWAPSGKIICSCYADGGVNGCTQLMADIPGNWTLAQCNTLCGRTARSWCTSDPDGSICWEWSQAFGNAYGAKAYKISTDSLHQCHTTVLGPNSYDNIAYPPPPIVVNSPSMDIHSPFTHKRESLLLKKDIPLSPQKISPAEESSSKDTGRVFREVKGSKPL